MTRRRLLTLFAVPMMGTTVPRTGAAQTGFHLTGHITGEHVEGGYFHLGDDFVMATPINSPLYPSLQGLVGSEVELTIHPIR